jgi:signal transduction histidine kinase
MSSSDPPIPLSRVEKFVRQLMHDVRNGLNAMDLEASLIAELTSDPELGAELDKLRGMVSNTAKTMQQLSPYLSDVSLNRINFPAREGLEEIKLQIEKRFSDQAAAMVWDLRAVEGNFDIDYELFQQALIELIGNALAFGEAGEKIQIIATVNKAGTNLEVRQKMNIAPESSPDRWGDEPLASTRRGHYGLGLFYARRIVAAHGGTLSFAWNERAGELFTRLAIPNQP